MGAACALVLVLVVIVCIWTPWGGSIPIGGTDVLAAKGLPRGTRVASIDYSPNGALAWCIKLGRPLPGPGPGYLADTYSLKRPEDSGVIDRIVSLLRHCRKAWLRPRLADSMVLRLTAEDGTVVHVFLGQAHPEHVVYLEDSSYVSKPLGRILKRIKEEKRGYSEKHWGESTGSAQGG
jgi:hypothetical protein